MCGGGGGGAGAVFLLSPPSFLPSSIFLYNVGDSPQAPPLDLPLIIIHRTEFLPIKGHV